MQSLGVGLMVLMVYNGFNSVSSLDGPCRQKGGIQILPTNQPTNQ